MDRLHVRLTTLGVAALIGAGAVGFGWRAATRGTPPAASTPATRAAEPAPTPAQLFERHCGGCHAAEDLRRGIRAAPAPAARRAELEQFVGSHGTSTDDDDRAILDYLFGAGR